MRVLPPDDAFLSLREVAALWGWSLSTAKKKYRAGRLPRPNTAPGEPPQWLGSTINGFIRRGSVDTWTPPAEPGAESDQTRPKRTKSNQSGHSET